MRTVSIKQKKTRSDKLPSINWYAILGPFFIGAVVSMLLFFLDPALFGTIMAMLGVATVGGGKFTILWALKPGAIITPYQIMFIVMYMEVSQGVIFLYNVDLIRRIKIVRKKLDQLRLAASRMFEKYPIMKKLSFFVLITFVALPFQGTGAIGGVVFSSVLGLSLWKTLMGVIIGSAAGNAILAVGVDIFQDAFADIIKNPMVTVTIIVVLVLVLWVINVMMVKTMKELAEEAKKQKGLTAIARTVKIFSYDMKKIDMRIYVDENLNTSK